VSEEIVVSAGVGELVFSSKPGEVLVAFGLGSCVGITAYDPVRKVGALLHAMLPESRNGDQNTTKYVNTGVVEMLAQLRALGAAKERVIWRFAGGAQMLIAPGLSDRFNVGQRNVEMTERVMKEHALRVSRSDTGGIVGRTIRLYLATGELTVRYVTGETIKL
jgi:chemotaxis protein CheD